MCVSHDVDLIAETVTPRQALRSMRLSLLGAGASRRERMTRLARPGVRAARALSHGLSGAPVAGALERCVELESEHGVTATYFFTVYPGAAGHRYDCTYALGDPCRFGGARVTVADIARRLDREGFEVGLHGSYNSAFADDRLTAEKDELEQTTGLTVTSIRQHFLHWDARVTPQLQSRAGFSADSTLGFNRNIGFRAGTSLPFRWFDVGRDSALDLVELPMLIGDVALLRADALELGPELAEETLLGRLEGVAEVSGVATLNFHPNSVEDPDYLALFRRAIDFGTERGAWFASVRDLDTWFRARVA
jgi:peptidoglycan/xylan/chitin deacetylase (PgdA/CDA1 family)